MAGNPIAIFSAPQVVVDGATQSWDASGGGYFVWTLTATRTMSTPTNPPPGAVIVIDVVQDATGSRLVTWPTNFSWPADTAPTLTITAAKCDSFLGVYQSATGKWRMMTLGLNRTY